EGESVMPPRIPMRSLRLVSLLALSAGVLLAGAGPSQQPGKDAQKAAKQAQKAAEKAAKQEVKLKEAMFLKEAYILMAMANHDYQGHRAKAMHQVEAAVKILDGSIMKNGTNGQKVVAHQQDIDAAQAAFIAKHQGKVHEPQALSDLQMKQALQLVINVEKAVAKLKQKDGVLGHLKNAIQQTPTARKVA